MSLLESRISITNLSLVNNGNGACDGFNMFVACTNVIEHISLQSRPIFQIIFEIIARLCTARPIFTFPSNASTE